MKITDFHSDLAESHKATSSPIVWKAITRHFPGALNAHPCHVENDKQGADVIIELHGEKPVMVDLKTRTKDFAKNRSDIDLAIELTYGSRPGWALKETLADFYLFVCLDTGRSACYRSAPFRMAVKRHGEAWSGFYRVIDTCTAGRRANAISRAVIVPASIVQTAINRLDWGA